jgi:hypothetical protein
VITEEQIKAMNPEMAAMWIVGSGARPSKAQWQVLVIACRNGGYVAAGKGEHEGHVERVPASALLALVRRGYLTHCYSSEGGVAGRLSERSREKLADALKGQLVAPAGTGQRCGAANACHLYRGHDGQHEDWRGDKW